MANYLTVQQIIILHDEQIELYGGSYGIRDEGALEAAAHRPQSGYYQDMIAEAAALMESLAINHPFIDGNKRIAFYAASTFLIANGYEVEADEMKIYRQMIELFETGNFKFVPVEKMLRAIAREQN